MVQRNQEETQTSARFSRSKPRFSLYEVNTLTLQYFSLDPALVSPFDAAFEWLHTVGVKPADVLWIMPRIETVASFKRCWALQHKGLPTVGPRIQTADRLSQPAAMGPWLALQADLVGVLRELPALTGGASRAQLWGLAAEYLELALRQVLVQKHNITAISDYASQNSFAAEEVQVVAQLAETYEAELVALLPQLHLPAGQPPLQVVWFDDGETVPGLWLSLVYPEVPVQVFRLALTEGPQPWQQLGAQRFIHQPAPVVLQVAPDENAQAQQAAKQILDWLQENPAGEIAVAVLDRLAARRMVSLLADAGVLVDDRTGWRLSTSNVAGWLDSLLEQYSSCGMLNSISQPFTGVFLENFQPWAFCKPGTCHTLARWSAAFCQLFQQHGLDEILQQDEAGQQLMVLMGLMRHSTSQAEFSADEFLSAWRHWAENQRFRPFDIESPVRMVPLLSTRMRRFKRVLVLGCALSHFQESPPGLLPPSVAQALGFPGPRLARIQKISALHELLLHSSEVTLLHCAQVSGKPETLLPELTWLDIVLREPDQVHAHWSTAWYRMLANLEIQVREQPEQPLFLAALRDGGSVPATLRVTALDDWMQCRLGFGLKHALPWAAQAEQGSMRYEQLRGIFIHKVLEKTAVSMARPGQPVNQLDSWKKTLQDQAQAVWSELVLTDRAVVYPFLKFFDQLVPRIAGKLMERQIQGWQFRGAEQVVEHQLDLPSGSARITLKGRVDRVDSRGQSLAIADIKFVHPAILKKRLAKPLSQPQLPAYQLMLGDPDAQLDFLGLHKDKVDWVSFPPLGDELREAGHRSWGEALFSELKRDMAVFFSGDTSWQAMPGSACEWCSVRGVCRPEFSPLPAEEEDLDE
jgi:ATP-dependent helicase/nuclease subunit B